MWDDLAVSLIPFVLLIVFWLLLMRSVSRRAPWQEEALATLKEIREELERIRRAVESRVS